MTKQELQEQLQKDALEAIGDKSWIGVNITVGGGKTLLGLKHMSKQYRQDSLFDVVAPFTSIFEDWKREAIDHGYEYLLEHIRFVTYRGLSDSDGEADWTYLDECESLTNTHCTYLDVYRMKGGKVLGLTGTYPTRGKKAMLCQQYVPQIFNLDMEEAIGNGMLNDYRIFVHFMNLDKRKNIKRVSAKGKVWYTSELDDYLFWTQLIENAEEDRDWIKLKNLKITRMKKMQAYRTKVEYTKHILNKISYKTLIFATSKEQADEVSKHSYHSGIPKKQRESNLQRFAEGIYYRLACVEQLSMGKTIPDLRMGIIMHCYANDRLTRQKIGRFERLAVDDVATIHILCYENSVDLHRVKSALKKLDPTKIKVIRTNYINKNVA